MPVSIRYHTVREQILDQIREDIIQGAIKPGQRLNEMELATRYQVSRTPLREAIRQLQMEGLIEAIPNKGARVAFMTDESVQEFFEARRVMEGFAIRQSCQHIPGADIQRLRVMVKQMQSNNHVADFLSNCGLVVEFHTLVMSHCKNQHLMHSVNAIMQKFATIQYLVVKTRGVHAVYDCLEKLVETLAARSPDDSERLVIASIDLYRTLFFDEILKSHPTLVRS
jgi:DNA-binding GntR family transcriptional regulator